MEWIDSSLHRHIQSSPRFERGKMKKLLLLALALLVTAALCSCHNTKKQYHKMIDGIHDVFLEGT